MKKPLQATRTTPPLVEYVAVGRGDGWGAAGLAGRVWSGVFGAVASVVVGGIGAVGTPGCKGGGGAGGEGGLGAGTGTGPGVRTVDTGFSTTGAMLVAVVVADDDAN